MWASNHTGDDLAAPSGTPARAVTAGVVESAGWAGAYGNQVVVRHAGGLRTSYSHLSLIGVDAGDVLRAGAVLGRVGRTGNTTGPHLHLELRPDGGRPIDPCTWLEKRGAGL